MHSTNRWHCGGQPARRLQTSPVILFTCVLLAVSFFASKDVEAAALPSVKYHAPSYGSGVIHRGTFHVPEKEDPTVHIEDKSELKKAGAHGSKKALPLGKYGAGYSSLYGYNHDSKAYNAYSGYGYSPLAKSDYGAYYGPSLSNHNYGYGPELLHDLLNHPHAADYNHEHEPFEFYDFGKVKEYGAYAGFGKKGAYSPAAKKTMPALNNFNGYPTMNYGPVHPIEHDPVHFIDLTKYGHAALDGYASTGKKIPLPLGSPGYGSYDVFGGYIPHSAHHNAHGYDKLLESTYSGHGIYGHLPIKPEAYGYGGLPGYHGADHFGDVDHLHSHKYPIDSKSSLSGYDLKGEYGYGSKLKTDDIALGGYDYANGKLAKPFNPPGAYNSYYGSLDFQDNHGYDNDYNGYYKMHLSYGPLEHHDILANKKLDFYGHFIHPENWESYKL